MALAHRTEGHSVGRFPFMILTLTGMTEVVELLVRVPRVPEDEVEVSSVMVNLAELQLEFRVPLPLLLALMVPSAGLV